MEFIHLVIQKRKKNSDSSFSYNLIYSLDLESSEQAGGSNADSFLFDLSIFSETNILTHLLFSSEGCFSLSCSNIIG